MKQTMRRVLMVLAMAACFFALTACAKNDDTVQIKPEKQKQLEEMSHSLVETMVKLTDEEFQANLEYLEDQDEDGLMNGLHSWADVRNDLGQLVSIDSYSYKKTLKGYEVNIKATFEKRKADIFLGWDKKVQVLTDMSFTPEFTTQENMKKAAVYALIGIGTVFCVLVFMSLIISCFKYINAWEAGKQKAQTGTGAAVRPVEAPAPEPAAEEADEEEVIDDLELVAVITAAIAASQGTAPEGLVVRSIKRAPLSKWKRA